MKTLNIIIATRECHFNYCYFVHLYFHYCHLFIKIKLVNERSYTNELKKYY